MNKIEILKKMKKLSKSFFYDHEKKKLNNITTVPIMAGIDSRSSNYCCHNGK